MTSPIRIELGTHGVCEKNSVAIVKIDYIGYVFTEAISENINKIIIYFHRFPKYFFPMFENLTCKVTHYPIPSL